MFSSEFWEIFRNTFFTEHLRVTASANCKCVEAVARNVLRKKYFFVFVFFLIKLQVWPTTLLKIDRVTSIFLWIFVNILRTSFLLNTFGPIKILWLSDEFNEDKSSLNNWYIFLTREKENFRSSQRRYFVKKDFLTGVFLWDLRIL